MVSQHARFGSLVVLLSLMAKGMVAQGGVLSFVTDDTPIPDGSPTGLTLTLAQAPPISSISQIAVRLSHESIGDLTVKVFPPAGPAFTLFERLGVTPGNPDGATAALGAFVLSGNGPATLVPQAYRFGSEGLNLETAAQQAINNPFSPVVAWDPVYAAKSWESGPFPAGTWTLQVIDTSELSGGAINAAELLYTSANVVPEPGVSTLTLLSGVLSALWFGQLGRRR